MVQTRTGELGTAVVDGHYRYHLTRDFGEGEGSVGFVLLNPSKADHDGDDNTVARCIGIAQEKRWRVLEVGNLYARCATYPRELRNESDPVGPSHR